MKDEPEGQDTAGSSGSAFGKGSGCRDEAAGGHIESWTGQFIWDTVEQSKPTSRELNSNDAMNDTKRLVEGQTTTDLKHGDLVIWKWRITRGQLINN